MAYEVVMPYHLHMPSYFLETFTEYPYPDNNNKVVYSYSICKKDETRRWNEMRLKINNLNSVEEPKTTYLTSRPSSLGHCYYFFKHYLMLMFII